MKTKVWIYFEYVPDYCSCLKCLVQILGPIYWTPTVPLACSFQSDSPAPCSMLMPVLTCHADKCGWMGDSQFWVQFSFTGSFCSWIHSTTPLQHWRYGLNLVSTGRLHVWCECCTLVGTHLETEEEKRCEKGEMVHLGEVQGFWLYKSNCRMRQRQIAANQNTWMQWTVEEALEMSSHVV